MGYIRRHETHVFNLQSGRTAVALQPSARVLEHWAQHVEHNWNSQSQDTADPELDSLGREKGSGSWADNSAAFSSQVWCVPLAAAARAPISPPLPRILEMPVCRSSAVVRGSVASLVSLLHNQCMRDIRDSEEL